MLQLAHGTRRCAVETEARREDGAFERLEAVEEVAARDVQGDDVVVGPTVEIHEVRSSDAASA